MWKAIDAEIIANFDALYEEQARTGLDDIDLPEEWDLPGVRDGHLDDGIPF